VHHLTIRHTQPGEVVRQPQFQPALNLVRPSKTNMVRFAQRNFSSRCTPFACSITYDAPTRRKASICQRHGRARACLTPMHVGWGCHRLRRKFSGNPTRHMPPTSSPAPPAGTAPPSRVLLRHPRRRLGYPRAHVGRPIFIECLLSNPTVQVFQRFQGARVRHEKMVKRMSATLIRTRKLAPANAGRWF
jgi:hypothetical protein